MKVVKAMVHVETVCPGCGGPTVRMGLADVTHDGRIGEPVYSAGDGELCNSCNRKERDAENAEYRKSLQQKRWARMAEHLPKENRCPTK